MRARTKAGKIRVFAFDPGRAAIFLGLPLCAPGFFLLPLHLLGLLTVSLGERGFSWTSDNYLLGLNIPSLISLLCRTASPWPFRFRLGRRSCGLRPVFVGL